MHCTSKQGSFRIFIRFSIFYRSLKIYTCKFLGSKVDVLIHFTTQKLVGKNIQTPLKYRKLIEYCVLLYDREQPPQYIPEP